MGGLERGKRSRVACLGIGDIKKKQGGFRVFIPNMAKGKTVITTPRHQFINANGCFGDFVGVFSILVDFMIRYE